MLGTSKYINNPNISAAKGSAPERSMDDVPESRYFKLRVEKIYGRANENVECKIRNAVVYIGLIETKLEICPKSVNGMSAIVMNMIEYNRMVYV